MSTRKELELHAYETAKRTLDETHAEISRKYKRRGRIRRFYMSLGNYLTAFTTKEGLAEKHLNNVLREIEEAQK